MNRQVTWLGDSGTLGQTRYQEYDPRTGAAIGAPMTEAEYHSRSTLRPFTRVRAVFVPNTFVQYPQGANMQRLQAICSHVKQTGDNACLAWQMLNGDKVQSAGLLTPAQMAQLENAIIAALYNYQAVDALYKSLGCGSLYCAPKIVV